MSKLITEKERSGSSWMSYKPARFRRKIRLDEDGEFSDERYLPSQHEGMKKPHGYETKGLSDFLSPIKGFLAKSCGRPWDDVYSEICAHVKLDSVTQRHVRDHVDSYVAVNTFIEKETRKVWVSDNGRRLFSRGKGTEYPVEGSAWDFYVHPRTGRLHKNTAPRFRFHRRPEPVTKVVVDDMTELHQIDGIWYRIDFAPFPAHPRGFKWCFDKEALHRTLLRDGNKIDALTHRRLENSAIVSGEYRWNASEKKYDQMSKYIWPERYASKKTQLGSRELRERKLKNDIRE